MDAETIAEKLASQQRLYLFHRAEGFYPVILPEATVDDNIQGNPGTIRVDEFGTGRTWTAVDGWINPQEKRP